MPMATDNVMIVVKSAIPEAAKYIQVTVINLVLNDFKFVSHLRRLFYDDMNPNFLLALAWVHLSLTPGSTLI